MVEVAWSALTQDGAAKAAAGAPPPPIPFEAWTPVCAVIASAGVTFLDDGLPLFVPFR